MDTSPQNAIKQNASGKTAFLLPLQIFGVLIVLVVIALLLNYLNLFRLDFYFPSLSTLPRIQPKPLQYNPYQKPPTFTYDQAIPEKSLPDFLKRVLKPEFLPQSFTIIHNLNANNEKTDTDYTYGTTWTIDTITFHGLYHFNIGTNNHMDSQIIIAPSSPRGSNPKSLISQYFITDGSKAACKTLDQTSQTQVCEIFYPDFAGIKHGFGAVINIPNQSKDFIFACEIPAESIHSTWRSCLQQFSTTGIQ